MGTCWATNSWAANSWVTDSWAAVSETLGLGDLTTAFAIWLRGVRPDKTTQIRDRLAVHYSVAQPADNATLLSRFLKNRS